MVFFTTFTKKFKSIIMEHKDLIRLKLLLVEKKRTGTWLALYPREPQGGLFRVPLR